MNLLITGAKGQLGSEIRGLSAHYKGFNFVYADLPELDICSLENLQNFVKSHHIQVIINCAAYTAVDKAEADSETAQKVNSLGVKNLVKVMQELPGKLIQISTDYVFDGTKHEPYVEADIVNPQSVYGLTKLQGEQYVLESGCDSIVIRTSWLYSAYGANFVKTMRRLGAERSELKVIFDQIGTPTYAHDLAKACLDMLSTQERLDKNGKLYHYSNEGVASWYDFAKAIMALSQLDCDITPIETKDYPTPAKRPFYAVLNKGKIKSDFNLKIPYWQDSLKACIERLKINDLKNVQ